MQIPALFDGVPAIAGLRFDGVAPAARVHPEVDEMSGCGTQSRITVHSIQRRKADVLEAMIHKPAVKNIEANTNETGSRLLSGYSCRSRLAVSMPVKQEDAKSHPAIRDRHLCVNRINDALVCHRTD